MLVATGTDLNDNSVTDSFTDNRNPELSVLDNPTVCRSAWIQRNAQMQQDAPRRFEIVPPLLTNKQRREYVRYKENDKGNLI
jgi:hypothetical protein